MIMPKFVKILLLLPLILSFLGKEIVLAYSSSDIVNISLKLSLCGDGFTEGDEDCEPSTGVTETCLDYGYQSGMLTCDYSCSYDYSACKYIPVERPEEEDPIEEDYNFEEFISNLPFFINLYDLNNDGHIDFAEFTNILYTWVDSWKLFRQTDEVDQEDVKGTCDVNNDSLCNVIDFSIILYYVDND